MDLHYLACQQGSLHRIQLDVNYADIDKHKDTYDLCALLKKSAVTKGSYNLQNLRNEWTNFNSYLTWTSKIGINGNQ